MSNKYNIKVNTIKILEKMSVYYFCILQAGKYFIERTQSTKERYDKLGFIKTQNFCSSKDTIKKI